MIDAEADSMVGSTLEQSWRQAWLSLAAAQGRRWAEEQRLEIKPLLTAQEQAEAKALSESITSPK